MKRCSLAKLSLAGLALFALSGCERRPVSGWQGYIEAEFVHVAAPLGGRLDHLAVRRGTQIAAGAPLFSLERASEEAAVREAADRLQSAEARLADLRKGQRPSELAAVAARLDQAKAAAELSQRDLDRLSDLFKTGATPANEFDRARLTHDRNRRAVEELTAQLETARLGGRSDAIAAAEAEVAAASAARARAAWAVAQKTQAAPTAALVHDTLFREGEFVAAATPVVVLLPAENVKVRFFVSEPDFASLKAGDALRVSISGRTGPVAATVNYLSPRPEYTPPVLYNRDNRAKLVFMVEAGFDPAVARDLHPGQPVDVTRAP